MPISIEKLREAARRVGADMMHSDDDLGQKMEPAYPGTPEAGPSNDELIENSHAENGGSPVLDGDIHAPERQNVTAIKDALEAQSEMEIGKPIEQKQEEIKAEEAAESKAIEVDAKPGKQIIINIAKEKDRAVSVQPQANKPLGGEHQSPRANVTSDGMGTGAFGGTDLAGTPNMEKRGEVGGEQLYQCFILDQFGDTEEATNTDTPAQAMSFFTSRGIDPADLKTIDKPNKTVWTYMRTAGVRKVATSLVEYKKLKQERDKIISQNRSRLMRGEKPLPVPPKPQTPMVPVAYAADGTYEGRLEDPADCPAGCTVKWEPIKGASSKLAADYWGYDDWVTGHTALMINNESGSYSTLKNLVRNALKKKMTPKELGAQLARFFKKQAEESQKFYAENAQGARDRRGEWERKQLEGVTPTGNTVQDIGDKLLGMYYELGGTSDWENEPAGDVNWEEIATSEMESERAEHPDKYPKTNKEDDKLMKGMGIKMESLKTAKQPMPQKGSPEWHQLKIAIKTLQMNDAMAGVMGGPSKDEARQIVARYGINPAKYDTPDTSPITGKQGGEGAAMTPEEIEKEAGFNFFFPGQVLREIAPELQHNLVDYPNDNNTPMQYPDISGDKDEVPEEVAIAAAVEEAINPTIIAYVSTSPAAAAGIGRDGKPEVMEGLPIRKENDIRGYMFTDEFYGQNEGVPGAAFASKAALLKKLASLDENHVFGSALRFLNSLKKTAGADEAKQFSIFLKKVCGEIAATFVAMFKVTSRPMLDKVPGKGEIQLAQVEQPQGLSSFNIYNTSSRVKYLMDKLTDSEIKDAINGSSAQGAVWHDGEEGGYVYEVFVRIDDIDTESLIATYSFIVGTKE